MADWQIGTFEFDFSEVPFDGPIPSSGEMLWKQHNPLGFNGTVVQYLGTKAREPRLHMLLSPESNTTLEAIAAAHEPVTFKCPRPPYEAGVSVTIVEYTAVWNSSVRGDNQFEDYFWDVWLGMVVTGPFV